MCICGASSSESPHNSLSLLKTFELCVKWSRDSGSVVAVLSPNKKFHSSVFIYDEVSQ